MAALSRQAHGNRFLTGAALIVLAHDPVTLVGN